MKLREIKDLFSMDCGAPSPLIISNEDELSISFHLDSYHEIENNKADSILITDICILKFEHYLTYTFGLPGNETLHAHPYQKLGIESYAFYELIDSHLIKQLKNTEKSHPYYNSEEWKTYHHYIITFHDNMFECIAKDFSVEISDDSKYNIKKGIKMIPDNNSD